MREAMCGSFHRRQVGEAGGVILKRAQREAD